MKIILDTIVKKKGHRRIREQQEESNRRDGDFEEVVEVILNKSLTQIRQSPFTATSRDRRNIIESLWRGGDVYHHKHIYRHSLSAHIPYIYTCTDIPCPHTYHGLPYGSEGRPLMTVARSLFPTTTTASHCRRLTSTVATALSLLHSVHCRYLIRSAGGRRPPATPNRLSWTAPHIRTDSTATSLRGAIREAVCRMRPPFQKPHLFRSCGNSSLECSTDSLALASESTGSHEPVGGGSFGDSESGK